MACLDVSRNRKKYKDIFLFTWSDIVIADRLDEARIVKGMSLSIVPNKTDTALVFPLMHVYNTHAILTV